MNMTFILLNLEYCFSEPKHLVYEDGTLFSETTTAKINLRSNYVGEGGRRVAQCPLFDN